MRKDSHFVVNRFPTLNGRCTHDHSDILVLREDRGQVENVLAVALAFVPHKFMTSIRDQEQGIQLFRSAMAFEKILIDL